MSLPEWYLCLDEEHHAVAKLVDHSRVRPRVVQTGPEFLTLSVGKPVSRSRKCFSKKMKNGWKDLPSGVGTAPLLELEEETFPKLGYVGGETRPFRVYKWFNGSYYRKV